MCRVPVLVSSTCYGMCVPCLLPSCSASQTSDRVTPADCFQFDPRFQRELPCPLPRDTPLASHCARGGRGDRRAARSVLSTDYVSGGDQREFVLEFVAGSRGDRSRHTRDGENRRYGLCTCSMRVTQTRPTHRDQGRDRRVHTGDTATTRRARGQTGQGAHSHSHRSRILTPALGSRKRTRNHQ